jgi:hypothetical protein
MKFDTVDLFLIDDALRIAASEFDRRAHDMRLALLDELADNCRAQAINMRMLSERIKDELDPERGDTP